MDEIRFIISHKFIKTENRLEPYLQQSNFLRKVNVFEQRSRWRLERMWIWGREEEEIGGGVQGEKAEIIRTLGEFFEVKIDGSSWLWGLGLVGFFCGS